MEWLNLQKDEKKVGGFIPQSTPWMANAALIGLLAGLFIAGMISLVLLGISSDKNYCCLTAEDITLYGSLVFISVLLLFLAYGLLSFRHAAFAVTDKRVLQRSGFIGYSVKSVSFSRISDITVRHSALERLFGVGSVLVQTLAGQVSSGSGGAEIQFLFIRDPEEAVKQIYSLMGKKGAGL